MRSTLRPTLRHALVGMAIPVLAVALSGCEVAVAPTPTLPPCQGCVAVDMNGATSASIVPATAWPAAAPSDIPAFPGRLVSIDSLRTQAADGTFGLRMYFAAVPIDQFWNYLAILRGDGYRIQGLVYYSQGQSAADAQTRADQGNFDAVRATKGARVITATVPTAPSGPVTYDVDGLSQAESDAIPGTSASSAPSAS